MFASELVEHFNFRPLPSINTFTFKVVGGWCRMSRTFCRHGTGRQKARDMCISCVFHGTGFEVNYFDSAFLGQFKASHTTG